MANKNDKFLIIFKDLLNSLTKITNLILDLSVKQYESEYIEKWTQKTVLTEQYKNKFNKKIKQY